MNTYMFKYSNIHVPRQSMSSGTLGDHTPVAPQTYTVSMALDGDMSQSSSQNIVQISPHSLFQPLHAILPCVGAGIGGHGWANHNNKHMPRLHLENKRNYRRSMFCD